MEKVTIKQIDGDQMRKLGDIINNNIPKGLGFCILTFETGESDVPSNYLSNCERSDMIKALRETAERLEKNSDFRTPEPKNKLTCIDCNMGFPDTFQIRSLGCPNCGGVLMEE